jgi:hypothetical protein
MAVGATPRRSKYAGLSFFAICFLAAVDNFTATILNMSLPNVPPRYPISVRI